MTALSVQFRRLPWTEANLAAVLAVLPDCVPTEAGPVSTVTVEVDEVSIMAVMELVRVVAAAVPGVVLINQTHGPT